MKTSTLVHTYIYLLLTPLMALVALLAKTPKRLFTAFFLMGLRGWWNRWADLLTFHISGAYKGFIVGSMGAS